MRHLLWPMTVVFVALGRLGLVINYTVAGFLHMLLVLAGIAVLVGTIGGPPPSLNDVERGRVGLDRKTRMG
jgi:hypothetical protein